MCIFSSGMAKAVVASKAPNNAAPIVTGRQTGVDNPIDTAQATERLKKMRLNERFTEGQRRMRASSVNDLKIGL